MTDNNLSSSLAHVTASLPAHLDVALALMKADQGNLLPTDLVCMGALQRSCELIRGFVPVVEQRNLLFAAPAVRMQLDSAMRVFACNLADPARVLETLLKGDDLKRMKSHTGAPLTDRHLREELGKIFPWIDGVYKATSGHVHLSASHLSSVVAGTTEERSVTLSIGAGGGRKWTDAELAEVVAAFAAATKALLQVVAAWLVAKEKGPDGAPGTPAK